MNESAANILKAVKLSVSPYTFTLISIRKDRWLKLLDNAALSPRMDAPFMIFSDGYEITLLLDEVDFAAIREALGDAKFEGGFRLVTFDVELDFNVVGFLAEVTRILSEARISIVALSAFSRDHLLIKQTDLARALKSLSGYVKELC